jgi:hypothetical protein
MRRRNWPDIQKLWIRRSALLMSTAIAVPQDTVNGWLRLSKNFLQFGGRHCSRSSLEWHLDTPPKT